MENESTVQMEIEYYVEGVFLLIIGTFGIIGNVSAIVVFTRQNLQKSFYALMLSLAAFDLVYIITSILCYGIPPLSPEYKESAIYNYSFAWIRSLCHFVFEVRRIQKNIWKCPVFL